MASKGWSALKERSTRGPSANYLRLKPGESAVVRFLVRSEDDVVYFRQHYFNKQGYRLCEDDTDDLSGNCRYCDEGAKPGENYAFNVINRKDNKVQVLQLALSHCVDLWEHIEEYGDIVGADYRIKRTGDQAQTRYSFVRRKESAMDAMDKKLYKESRYDLEELYDPDKKNPKVDPLAGGKKKKKRVKDETEAQPPKSKRKQTEVEEDDDEEEDEEEEQPQKKGKVAQVTKAKKKSPPPDDDEEEDDEEEEDEDEEDEEDEEEEDEEEEDEEEEDEEEDEDEDEEEDEDEDEDSEDEEEEDEDEDDFELDDDD